MKQISTKQFFKNGPVENVKIITASIALIYLLISLYFMNHFFFNTVINGVDVSLKAHEVADDIIASYVKDYSLELIERNGETEEIMGQEIGLKYNRNSDISKVCKTQSSFR